jgi:hypothetical protein
LDATSLYAKHLGAYMAVNLSPIFGAGAQLFNNDGVPLAGGLIYTYAAGSSTPAAVYTSSLGSVAHANPIVLDSAGRVPGGEIWMTDNVSYKFVVKDVNLVLIGTYDNLIGINSNFVSFTSQEESQTATQGQTVFTLTAMQYQPATNNLLVFVNGSKQIVDQNYTETSGTVITFADGLNVGDVVDFTTATPVAGNVTISDNVSYNEGCPGAVTQTLTEKLQETVSVKDFGAVGDGVTDDSVAIRDAIDCVSTNGGQVYFPAGTYLVTADSGDTSNTAIYVPSFVRIVGASQGGTVIVPGANNTVCFRMIGLNGGIENLQINNPSNTYSNVSGIRLAPIDESQTTTRTDVEFNSITNVSIRRVAEAIILKCGPTVGGADSYCYYNTFTNIDIRNCTLGIWLKIPNGGDPGSGCNRNTFISCRVGETGTNTGLQIDAGDTNRFVSCSFEGIQTGTSPNATPTAVKIAYNSGTYACVNNKFYGLEIEGCTRSVDNDNDLTEFYGWNDFTNTYYSPSGRPLAVDFTSGHLYVNSPIKGTTLTLNDASSSILLNPTETSTKKAVISTTAGASASYNGTSIKNNTALDGTQANTALPSWFLDIGGTEPGNGVGVSDSFGIIRKAAGSTSWVNYFIGDTNGAWKPGTDNTQDLGTASKRWAVVYAGTGTINTSDEREKQVAIGIKGLIKSFRFKDAVAKKGNKARIHFGVMAQQVAEAFKIAGLNPDDYALFCYDEWEASDEMEAGNRYGIRYDELLAFVISAL